MNAELERLAELEAKATPGPWRACFRNRSSFRDVCAFGTDYRDDRDRAVETDGHTLPMGNAGDDADFVAALRNAAPALLAAARERDEQAAELARLRENRDYWHQSCIEAQYHRDGANAQLACAEIELARLRAELTAWQDASQCGHPNPCTLGPLCPWCEIARLRAERNKLQCELDIAVSRLRFTAGTQEPPA